MEIENEIGNLYEALDAATQKLVEFMAMSGAMRQCLTALIASHPRPDLLRTEWQTRLPQWIDRDVDDGSMENQEYGETTRELLAQISQEIDLAARR